MKEHPMLFSGEMVRAILDGRKMQTRRILETKRLKIVTIEGEGGPYDRYQEWRTENGVYYECGSGPVTPEYPRDICPYGKPGDRLWVREAFYQHGKWIKNGRTKTGKQAWKFKPTKHDDGEDVRLVDNPPEIVRPNKYRKPGWYKRPSIFMPRWASRILLEVTDVRVERVWEISAFDCLEEGIEGTKEALGSISAVGIPASKRVLDCFEKLWDSINAKRGFGWGENPWVWVVEFKRIKP